MYVRRETTVLLLGLDSAGKSTLLANMNGGMINSCCCEKKPSLFNVSIKSLNAESTDGITPTIGFASSNLDIGKFEVTMYDLGGGPRIRGIWKNYYPEVRLVVTILQVHTCTCY